MNTRSHGFTLIEMVISIIVLSIIAAVVASSIQGGVLAFKHTADALDSISKIRLSTERVARELRGIRRDPANTARYQVSEPFTANKISFVNVDMTSVTIDALLPSLRLSYDTPAGTYTLTDQVKSFTLAYYQQDGITTSISATNLAFIEFELVLTDSNGNDLAQRTRIGLRNRP